MNWHYSAHTAWGPLLLSWNLWPSFFTLFILFFILKKLLLCFLAENLLFVSELLIWSLNWGFFNSTFLANLLILQNAYLSGPRNPLAKNHKFSVFLGLFFVKIPENSLPILIILYTGGPHLLQAISNYEFSYMWEHLGVPLLPPFFSVWSFGTNGRLNGINISVTVTSWRVDSPTFPRE